MGLKEVLSRMKIVEIEPDVTVPDPVLEKAGGPAPRFSFDAPTSPTTSPGSPTSPVSPKGPKAASAGPANDIRDLLASMPPAKEIDVKALPVEPAEGGGGIPDFAAIFKSAGISDPPHGYSAYKVLEILSSPEFANLDSKAKAGALSGFLKMNPSGPVPITDVVQDAVRRDQALDKFEDFLRTKMKARTDQIEKENRDLQAEIDALALRNREKMDANRKALAEEEGRFARWQVIKRIEERKLFDAVAPFVETNPITTGSSGSGSSAAGETKPAAAAPSVPAAPPAPDSESPA
jgi:hypothetical protein